MSQTFTPPVRLDIANGNIVVSPLTSPPPPPPPPPIQATPLLQGWGGIFADGYQGYQGTGTDPSNIQANLDVMIPRGYNAFRCMIYNADFNHACSLTDIVNAVNVAKANNVWIILDHHGYTEPFTDLAGWLAFWKQVITAVSGLYDKIVYEPSNEPTSPDMVAFTNAYQAWIDQCRSLGDKHWIIVSVNNNGYDGSVNFPTVTDPLGQLFASFHGYFTYQWNQSNWNTAGAQAYANQVAGYASLASKIGVPFMSEFGADTGAILSPDNAAPGSAGYSPEGVAFVTELVNKLSSQGIGYMIWTAGGWTNTPGAGATGALNIWGQMIPSPSGTITPPSPPPPPPPVTGPIQTVVLVMMENQNYGSVIGSGQAPFVDGLVAAGATIPSYHGGYPGSSEGSYIALLSGDTYGASNGTTGIGDDLTLTLVDRFEAGKISWEAYREDSNGRGGDHFPFLDFTSIANDPVKMAHVHSGASPQDIIDKLTIFAPPAFLWFTPSDNHNMHDNTVSSGDSYLASFIPQILASPVFQAGKGLLMIVWDEYDPAPNVFLGAVKPGFVSQRTDLGHYSTLRLIENIFSLQPLSNGPSFPPGDIGALPLDIL